MKPNRQSNVSGSSASGQTVGTSNASGKNQAGKNQHAVRENLKQFDGGDSDTSQTADRGADADSSQASSKQDGTSRAARGTGSADGKNDSKDQTGQTDVEKFTASLNEATGGVVEPAINQAKEVFEHAKITFDEAKEVYSHLRETMTLGKTTFATCKASASKALAYVRKNPQPFLQAIVPGALGTVLLVDKFRGNIRQTVANRKNDQGGKETLKH